MDYEKNAIEILRMIGSNNGFTVADSGGKDSSVLTHIAMKAGCPFDVVAERKRPDRTAPEQQYHTRQWTSPELWNCTAMSQTNS